MFETSSVESITGRWLSQASATPRRRAPQDRTSAHFRSSPTVTNDTTGTAPRSRAVSVAGTSTFKARSNVRVVDDVLHRRLPARRLTLAVQPVQELMQLLVRLEDAVGPQLLHRRQRL